MITFDEAFGPYSAYNQTGATLGSDKNTLHSYGPMYERLLQHLQGTPAALLEIGVQTGGSLSGWRAFLGPHAVITGVEINPVNVVWRDETIVKADATTQEFADTVPDQSLDVIIDDGSHRAVDQYASWSLLRSKLKPGGVYVIEDIGRLKIFNSRFAGVPLVIEDFRPFSRLHDDVCAVFINPA